MASQVTITFNAWDGSKPGCSIEFIGFKFYEYWSEYFFAGPYNFDAKKKNDFQLSLLIKMIKMIVFCYLLWLC